MKLKEVAKALSNDTWVRMLTLTPQKPMSVTEILERVPSINRRESIYKALESMRKVGLIEKKRLNEKGCYVYFPNFERLVIRKNGFMEI